MLAEASMPELPGPSEPCLRYPKLEHYVDDANEGSMCNVAGAVVGIPSVIMSTVLQACRRTQQRSVVTDTLVPVFSKISCTGVPAMQATDLCGIKPAFVTVSRTGIPAMPAKDPCGNVTEACRSMTDPFSYLLPWPAACRSFASSWSYHEYLGS